jgi:hypothetical protein
MARCERHTWDTEDKEWCYICEEATNREKQTNMANQYYELISDATLVIGDTAHVAATWNLNLEQFLTRNAGKQIYILESSITTNQIRAIVI